MKTKEISKSSAISPLNAVLFILMSTFLGGFLWRIRGDHGWGAFTGMTAVAAGFLFMLLWFMPYRKKANSEILPLVIFFTAITNAGWGTLNGQICGVLESGAKNETVSTVIQISPLGGIVIMLLLGFGWMPFFSAFIGWYFSPKKQKLIHAILLIAVYYGAVLLCKASLSHLLVRIISPEATAAFADALKQAGKNLSPFAAYLKHFDDIAWAKKLAFGRNYFQEVETVAQAIGTLCTLLYTRFFLKDKIAARLSCLTSVSLAVAITVTDLFIFVNRGGINHSITPPEWLSGWSNWEYFTGFVFGLLLSVMLVAYVKKHPATGIATQKSILPQNTAVLTVKNMIALGFVLFVAVLSPLASRICYENDVVFGKMALNQTLITVILAVIGLAVCIPVAYYLSKHHELEGDGLIYRLAPIFTAVFFIVLNILYFFTGNCYLLIKSLTDTTIMMYASTVVICLLILIKGNL